MATMLITNGADIDGLPLSAAVSSRRNKAVLGRTVMRTQDFRNLSEYTQLIGLSRTELVKRRYPEKRISVTHIGNFNLDEGDSFILYTRKEGSMRVRIITKEQSEDNSGLVNKLECIRWPLIT
jgi:hypothetical protein